MAQDQSTKIIWMVEWIRTSRLSMKNSLATSLGCRGYSRMRRHTALGSYAQAVPGQTAARSAYVSTCVEFQGLEGKERVWDEPASGR